MKKVLLALALFVPSIGWGLTLSDIETQIRRNIRDTATDSSLQRYTDSVLDSMINEAQREVVTLTWCLETSTSIALTAGTTYYNAPNNLIAPLYATFTDTNNLTIELDQYSFKKALQEEADYERASSGTPDHFFIRPPDDGSANPEFAFLPVPGSTSTGTVKVFYIYYPADLSSDSDVPFDGLRTLYPYHYALVAHVSARIKEIEGKMVEADYYRKQFDRLMTIMVDRLGRTPNYSASLQAAPR